MPKRPISENGAPEEIRTPSLLIRSQVLYPVELRVRRSVAKERQPNQVMPNVQVGFWVVLARIFDPC